MSELSETCGVCAWAELRAWREARDTGLFDPVPPEHDCADHQQAACLRCGHGSLADHNAGGCTRCGCSSPFGGLA